MKFSRSANAVVTHTSVFQEPDALTQFEYGRQYDGKAQRTPETRLMFAILVDAVECFQRNLFACKRRDRRLFDQAETWIFLSESNWVFSFENVCAELHIDPGYLRSGLRRWRDKAQGSGERSRQISALRMPQQRLRNSDIHV